MPIDGNFIYIIYRTFSHITWFTLMNLGVIKGLGSGGQASHHLVLPHYKYHSSTATSVIRYCLYIPRIG